MSYGATLVVHQRLQLYHPQNPDNSDADADIVHGDVHADLDVVHSDADADVVK